MAGLGLDTVRQAKSSMRAHLRDAAWFRGCGIAPAGDGFVLRLNVSSDAPPEDVPHEWDGVPVEVVEIEEYAPRESQ